MGNKSRERPIGAIDFKTNICGIADLFPPTGRSCGKPIGGEHH
jgi:hypothetical protein